MVALKPCLHSIVVGASRKGNAMELGMVGLSHEIKKE
jgi:hypothetical protein